MISYCIPKLLHTEWITDVYNELHIFWTLMFKTELNVTFEWHIHVKWKQYSVSTTTEFSNETFPSKTHSHIYICVCVEFKQRCKTFLLWTKVKIYPKEVLLVEWSCINWIYINCSMIPQNSNKGIKWWARTDATITTGEVIFSLHYQPSELMRYRQRQHCHMLFTWPGPEHLLSCSEVPGSYHLALCCWDVSCAPTGCEGEPFSVIPIKIGILISGTKQNISSIHPTLFSNVKEHCQDLFT